MKITIDIDESSLDRLTDELSNSEAFKRAMGRACAVVERRAKELAPKDTGALRRSITSEVNVVGKEVVGEVFTPLEYAPYVEYGTGKFAKESGHKGREWGLPWHYQDDQGNWHSTSGQHPQPFMKPALDESREEILRILKEAFQ